MGYAVTLDELRGTAHIARTGGTSGDFASADLALQDLHDSGFSGEVVFCGGRHVFAAGVTLSNADISVVLQSGATLVPEHTGLIGLMEFTGARSSLKGDGGILVETTVNDQVAVKFTGVLQPRLEGPWLEFQNSTATSANPMTGFHFSECVNIHCTQTSVYPNEGTRGWYFEGGTGGVWASNYWGTKTSGSLRNDDSTLSYTPRAGWRGLDIYGWEYFVAGQDCVFRGVGIVANSGIGSDDDTVGDTVVDAMIRVESSNSGESALDEEGHSKITGFLCESVHARNTIYIEGEPFFHLTDFQIGAGSGCKVFNLSTRTDCAIFVDGKGSKPSSNLWISGVSIHNQQWGEKSATSPPQIYLNGMDRCTIEGSEFGLVQKGPGILIRHEASFYVSIMNNVFYGTQDSSGGENPTNPISVIQVGAARNEVGAFFHYSGNVAKDFDNLWDSAAALPLGFAVANPVGLSFDRGITAFSGSVTMTAGTRNIAATGAFTNAVAGDLFEIRGSANNGGATTSNVGLMKILTVTDADNVIVATNTYFSDFVATETASMTIDFYPRHNSNVSYATVAV